MTTNLYHRNKDSYNAIWHFDREALTSFDNIINEEWAKLEEIRDETIRNHIERAKIEEEHIYNSLSEENKAQHLLSIEERIKNSYILSRSNKNISIFMETVEKLEASSFEDALNDPKSQNKSSHEFEFNMVSGEIDCNLTLNDDRLTIRASPEQRHETSTLFFKLDQWALENKLPKIYSLWSEFKFFPIIAFTIMFLMSLSVLLDTNPAIDEIRKEVQILIKDGISEQEIPKAIELLLSLSSDITSDQLREQIKDYDLSNSIGITFWIICSIAFLISIFSLFPLKSKISIGRGEESIKKQRKWKNFLVISIPALIMAVFASFLGSFLLRLTQ